MRNKCCRRVIEGVQAMKVFRNLSLATIVVLLGAAGSHAVPIDHVFELVGGVSNMAVAAGCFATGLLGVARLAGDRR